LGDPCSSWDDCDNDWICLNKKCSPCCQTLATSTGTATGTTILVSAETTTATTAPVRNDHDRISTGAAVGIGLGATALFAVLVAIGLWLCWSHRKKRHPQEVPGPSHFPDPILYRPPSHEAEADSSRHLLEKHAHRVELHAASRPSELHNDAVELYELDASMTTTRQHTPEPVKTASVLQTPVGTVARLAEMRNVEVSPETRTYDTLERAQLSPVSQEGTIPAGNASWGMRMEQFEQRHAEEPAPAYTTVHYRDRGSA